METLKKSSANQNMLVRVEAALAATITQVLKQGFFGTARFELRIADGTISGKQAKDVFDAMWAGGATSDDAADRIIAAKGMKQISDEAALAKLVDDVIAANPSIVAEFRAGKEKAFNALVGKAMAASKGQANPAQLNALFKRRLS